MDRTHINNSCPFCRAALVHGVDEDHVDTEWKCGTINYIKIMGGYDRTELCREREARQIVVAKFTKLREIVERYRVWATSESPTEVELRRLKEMYDELF